MNIIVIIEPNCYFVSIKQLAVTILLQKYDILNIDGGEASCYLVGISADLKDGWNTGARHGPVLGLSFSGGVPRFLKELASLGSLLQIRVEDYRLDEMGGSNHLKFTCPFEADMPNSGTSRCRGWILRCQKLLLRLSRAPHAIWDPIFGHVAVISVII